MNTSVALPYAFPNQQDVRLLGWNLEPEYQFLVHPHFKGYPAPPYYMHLLFALLYFILLCSSFIGNGIVIWIFSTSKSLRNGSNMLIINLAVLDILMGLEMPMFIANSFNERLLGYDIGCTIYAALGSLSGIGESINNAVIAYDRYRTISRPLDGRMTKQQAGIFIVLVWFWTIPFTALPSFKIWGRYVAEGFLTTCSFDYLTENEETRVFVATIFVWAYCLPMILILYFYTRLFGFVQQHEKLLKDQAKKMNVKSLAANKDLKGKAIELRIAKACFIIWFLFVSAWTPYAAVALIGAFGDRTLLTPIVTMIPAMACKIVSCVNPWVYAISHPRYRAELEKRVPWLGIQEKIDDSDANSVVTGVTLEAQSDNAE